MAKRKPRPRKRSGLSAKKLIIRKTPDRPIQREYAPRQLGNKTGLGIMEYWAELFRINEQLSKRRKMTDNEIRRQLQLEFPNSKGALALGDSKRRGRVTVNYFRTLYNAGKLSPNIPKPTTLSRRYDLDGDVVDPKYGRKKLLTGE